MLNELPSSRINGNRQLLVGTRFVKNIQHVFCWVGIS
jgi:hypothetical protein